jgi:hypothetical protein
LLLRDPLYYDHILWLVSFAHSKNAHFREVSLELWTRKENAWAIRLVEFIAWFNQVIQYPPWISPKISKKL